MSKAGRGAFVGLGSNLGDRRATIESACQAIDSLSGVRIEEVSSVFETEPVGPIAQGPYLNAVAMLSTELPPRGLLDALLAIERAHGRDRAVEQRWGPRTLDLDLLLYDSRCIDEPGLTVPHPHLHERLFVLEPLAELAAELVHPVLGMTITELLTQCRGRSAVNPAANQGV